MKRFDPHGRTAPPRDLENPSSSCGWLAFNHRRRPASFHRRFNLLAQQRCEQRKPCVGSLKGLSC
eukprot:6178179-Pleurochrysis_carterae.AAC.4